MLLFRKLKKKRFGREGRWVEVRENKESGGFAKFDTRERA